MEPKYLNTNEVAKLLKVRPLTLYRWRREGVGPPCAKIARRYLYAQAAVVEWVNQQTHHKSKQASTLDSLV